MLDSEEQRPTPSQKAEEDLVLKVTLGAELDKALGGTETDKLMRNGEGEGKKRLAAIKRMAASQQSRAAEQRRSLDAIEAALAVITDDISCDSKGIRITRSKGKNAKKPFTAAYITDQA